MKRFRRILKWTVIFLVLIVVVLIASGVVLYNKTYEAPFPDVHASTDSSVIARGKHLVYATAHCTECHYQRKDSVMMANGEEIALAGGGFPFIFPGGIFYSANISSDKETAKYYAMGTIQTA